MSERTTMNGKPVVTMPAKTIINFKSGFQKKLLCDGPTFSAGTACAYSCAFCYVPAAMLKLTKLTEEEHMQKVIRREHPLEALERQLLDSKGRPKHLKDGPLVIYASPLVDVAANMDLVRETVEICHWLLQNTSWHIRLLSKSNLLPKVAEGLAQTSMDRDARERVIYGLSTGTLDDNLAKAFEQGTPLPSRRIKALHELQDAGYRTFGMICPSLPMNYYDEFADAAAEAVRPNVCEHVWAEVINVRGESMVRTCNSLRNAGFVREAERLQEVSTDKAKWEVYARETFDAHAYRSHYRPGQLRFLQYVNNDNRAFWESEQKNGAVLL